jgi:hypothetical protein
MQRTETMHSGRVCSMEAHQAHFNFHFIYIVFSLRNLVFLNMNSEFSHRNLVYFLNINSEFLYVNLVFLNINSEFSHRNLVFLNINSEFLNVNYYSSLMSTQNFHIAT